MKNPSRRELMMVITPTYRSPPYAWSVALHTTCTRLLVRFMKKPDRPRATMDFPRPAPSARFRRRSRRMAFRPVRNFSTHTAEQPWAITVASAAPRTPMSRAKMKTGSSTMLTTAPRPTVIIPVRPKP